MKKEALEQARAAFAIEAQCIEEELAYFDDEAFGRAVDALAKAPRIGAAGCGHSGIVCQHFAHQPHILLCFTLLLRGQFHAGFPPLGPVRTNSSLAA